MAHQRDVTYLRPESLSEAWKALAGMDGSAKPVWSSPQPPDPASLELEAYVDLSALDLELIEVSGEQLTIGAGARLRSIQDSDLVQKAFGGMIQRAVRKTAHQGLRNLASLGGVLLDPVSAPEFATALLAGEPELVYYDGQQQSVPLAEAWDDGGLVGLPLGLRFDRKRTDDSSGSVQWVGRSPMDKAIVTAAVCLIVEKGSLNQVKAAAAGDGFKPQELKDTSEKLTGMKLDELDRSLFEKWVKAELSPSASYRAGVDYQLEVTPVLAWRVLQSALDEVNS